MKTNIRLDKLLQIRDALKQACDALPYDEAGVWSACNSARSIVNVYLLPMYQHVEVTIDPVEPIPVGEATEVAA